MRGRFNFTGDGRTIRCHTTSYPYNIFHINTSEQQESNNKLGEVKGFSGAVMTRPTVEGTEERGLTCNEVQ